MKPKKCSKELEDVQRNKKRTLVSEHLKVLKLNSRRLLNKISKTPQYRRTESDLLMLRRSSLLSSIPVKDHPSLKLSEDNVILS